MVDCVNVGQPGCVRGLPQPGQLTTGEELLGYHNNNNNCLNVEKYFLMECQPLVKIL